MTITLTQRSEKILREQASISGQSVEAFAERVLAETLEGYQQDIEESAAAIRESVSSDPSHDISLDEFRAQFAVPNSHRTTSKSDA